MGNGRDVKCSECFGWSLVGQSIMQRGPETRDPVGSKTLTGERQEDPLEGKQRRMDGSQT